MSTETSTTVLLLFNLLPPHHPYLHVPWQSNYAGIPCPGTLTPLAAILTAYAPVATFTQGCGVTDPSTDGFNASIAAAAAADLTVLVMGLDLTVEAEGMDRTDIGWPGVQADLIAAVAAASAGPVVLVIMAGGSVSGKRWGVSRGGVCARPIEQGKERMVEEECEMSFDSSTSQLQELRAATTALLPPLPFTPFRSTSPRSWLTR